MKIGNKNHISFELMGNNSPNELFNLNFYLGSKLISNESVYMPTYILSFQNVLDDIAKEQFKNIKFTGLSPEQAFVKVLKERDSDEPQFFRHLLQLDETIDQYTIFIFQMNEMIRFVWTCWDKNNCNPEHELNMVYAIQFPTEELILAVNTLKNQTELNE
jgi:hypothetical protein